MSPRADDPGGAPRPPSEATLLERPHARGEAPTPAGGAVDTAGSERETGADEAAESLAPTSARERDRPSAAAQSAASTTLPIEALWREEIASTRRFVALIFAILAALLIALPFLGGDPVAVRVFYAGIAVAAGAGLWLHWLVNHAERYAGFRAATCWGLATTGALTGVYYFGAFSPAPALLCLGIYFIALGQNRATAWLVYGMCAGFQAGLATLILLGAVRDRGLIAPIEPTTTGEAGVIQLLVQAILLGAFLLGRTSRKAKLVALRELDEAKQAVAQREGMLEEAREDLDRALRLGDAGRFSGREVGSFELGEVIGRGAMGDVYEATHRDTGEPAAVKLIQPERVDRPENRRRFLRELELAGSLEAPNIVRVLEVSRADAAVPYLAMERLYGETLSKILQAQRRLSAAEALELARQVGAGIDAAAKAGIVHRDLKPQNLFLHSAPGAHPTWKILDFGVSKLAEGGDTITHGHIVGTPAYMPPEQARSDRVDSRADVYALGAILYRALTGQRPFRGGDVAKTLHDVVYTMPTRPSDLADLPPHVDGVLIIALTKDRDARFETAADLAAALEQALRGELATTTRVRARELMRKLPWGTRASPP